MKKSAVLLLVLIIWNLNTWAQTDEKTQVHVDKTGKRFDWSLSNEGCYGCASFFWRVMRGEKPDVEGFYNYYLQFSTNSFYADKSLTSTYISDIKILFVDGASEYQAVETFYQLVPPEMKKFKKFKSKDPQQVIKLTWAPVKLLNK